MPPQSNQSSQAPNPANSQLNQMPKMSPQAVDSIYQKLRDLTMGLLQQGVPGMDKVVAALSAAHVAHNSTAPLGALPASPANPTPQGSYSGQ